MNIIKRQFTVMADQESELMMLSITDLNRMKNEFLEYYDKLIRGANYELQKVLKLKLRSMRECQNQKENFDSISDEQGQYMINLMDLDVIRKQIEHEKDQCHEEEMSHEHFSS